MVDHGAHDTSTPNILTDTTPVLDADQPSLVHSIITDAWGLYFAQGGVVMAAALRAMEAVLDRADLALASASAAFCRPVACGPVTTSVEILRNGRRGAQVQGLLRDATAPPGETSMVVTAVFTDPTLDGPTLSPVPRPAELVDCPRAPQNAQEADDEAAARDAVADASQFPLGFLDNTEWRVAASPRSEQSPFEPIPRMAVWFRFRDPPAPAGVAWDPALLPIPGDSLGTALVVALGGGDSPVGSVSLQISIAVLAPITGTWIGVDSRCTHVGSGLANGVLDLWSEDGTHVATVTQTAMLRTM